MAKTNNDRLLAQAKAQLVAAAKLLDRVNLTDMDLTLARGVARTKSEVLSNAESVQSLIDAT